jgi:hypothetical protein
LLAALVLKLPVAQVAGEMALAPLEAAHNIKNVATVSTVPSF